MSLWLSFVLGIVQGLTEFFPVSSSGHLALAAWLGGQTEGDLTFDILVHLATLAAILVVFRHDWIQLARSVLMREHGDLPRQLPLYLILATLPAVVVGLGFKDRVLWVHDRPYMVGALLCVTGLWLLGGLWRQDGTKSYVDLGWTTALIIGLAQAVAVLPGISRSGATIMMGIYLGLNRRDSARFSFMLAVPVIAGAGLLAIKDLLEMPSDQWQQLWGAYGLGFAAAFVSGLLALRLLMWLLTGRRFFLFGVYCLVVGLTAVVWGWLSP
ncbi:MAG: undecaprenyl-diphosphate phosphatase [Acidobacteria bacterium]|nr:undecaprenyl-diphosphate phosphatase [Acidobacteriota bacterium]